MVAARELADALYSCDPYWVKYRRPVFPPIPPRDRGKIEAYQPLLEPEFMPLEEQQELFAQQIKGLGRFRFLFRPAVAEGHVGSAVSSISLRDEDRDRETGEYQFPDAPLITRLRTALAKQSGIPIARLLAEQEKRIPPVLPAMPTRLSPPQPRQTDGQRAHPRARPKPTRQEDRDRQTVSQPPVEKAPVSPDETPVSLPHPRRYRRYRID